MQWTDPHSDQDTTWSKAVHQFLRELHPGNWVALCGAIILALSVSHLTDNIGWGGLVLAVDLIVQAIVISND